MFGFVCCVSYIFFFFFLAVSFECELEESCLAYTCNISYIACENDKNCLIALEEIIDSGFAIISADTYSLFNELSLCSRQCCISEANYLITNPSSTWIRALWSQRFDNLRNTTFFAVASNLSVQVGISQSSVFQFNDPNVIVTIHNNGIKVTLVLIVVLY